MHASDRIWTRVMREGASVEEAANEFGLSADRLEQVLIAVGRRRIARDISQGEYAEQRVHSQVIDALGY
jgi:hypothetical protein